MRFQFEIVDFETTRGCLDCEFCSEGQCGAPDSIVDEFDCLYGINRALQVVNAEEVSDRVISHIEELEARVELARQRCQQVIRENSGRADDIIWIDSALRALETSDE
jgi:hypothetical protein